MLLKPAPTRLHSSFAPCARTHWLMIRPVETDNPANCTPSESMNRSFTRRAPVLGTSSYCALTIHSASCSVTDAVTVIILPCGDGSFRSVRRHRLFRRSEVSLPAKHVFDSPGFDDVPKSLMHWNAFDARTLGRVLHVP